MVPFNTVEVRRSGCVCGGILVPAASLTRSRYNPGCCSAPTTHALCRPATFGGLVQCRLSGAITPGAGDCASATHPKNHATTTAPISTRECDLCGRASLFTVQPVWKTHARCQAAQPCHGSREVRRCRLVDRVAR